VDGSIPNFSSPIYNTPLYVGATTTIRANASSASSGISATAAATYTISGAPVAVLQNNLPILNIVSAKEGEVAFRVPVPAGQTRLDIVISGGSTSGDCDMYIKRGTRATLSTYDHRPYLDTSNEAVSITNPVAGDWFIMLHGFTAYTRVSLAATYTAPTTLAPDLTIYGPATVPFVSTDTFSPNDCAVIEGLVQSGTRRLLKFATVTRNQGTADLFMGNPVGNPLFEYASCHGHYHFKEYAEYLLLDGNKQIVASGLKIGFCLLDSERWSPTAATTARYDCTSQGIQMGWEDTYDSNLAGQWVDITGVAPGAYTLQIKVNPTQRIAETDYSNNSVLIPVTIPPESNRTMANLENGVAISGLSGSVNSQALYRIVVPAGLPGLRITIVGARGDCDLYVKRGAEPTLASYDYRPYASDSNEIVNVQAPAAGDWFVMLHGYSSYNSLTLKAEY
jgi:hypothetical protein